jgi:hypothetical protein
LVSKPIIFYRYRPADKDSKYITVNVNENYPEKEIVLQDFMDVEYIPLETTDEFITQGAVLSIGDKYILTLVSR